MSWLMEYITEDEDGAHERHTSWAKNWQEVMGYFMTWISPDSEVVKGKVTCYYGDKPYGNNSPCLNYNILPFNMEDEDED